MPGVAHLTVGALCLCITLCETRDESRTKSWTMALGSCLHPASRPWLSLSSIAQNKPDVVFLLGDLVYADYNPASLEWERAGSAQAMRDSDLLERFSKVWEVTMSEPHFIALLNSSAPVYAIWDDHEFMNNYDHGVDTGLYRAGRAAFDWHLLPSLANPVGRSGSYFTTTFPFAELFAFDTRSYRDQVTRATARQGSILGGEQKLAFREWLKIVPKGKWTLIASSGMFNRYPAEEEIDTSGDCARVDCSSDVWYRYEEERREILEMVTNVTNNVIFLSGDSHYAGIFRLGKNALEISASPLGAFGYSPPDTAFDSMRSGGDVVWIGGGDNTTQVFGEIEIAGDRSLTLSLNNVGVNGQSTRLYSYTVHFKDDALRTM